MKDQKQGSRSPFLKVLREPSVLAKVLLSSLFVSTLFVCLDSLVGGVVLQASTETLFLGSEMEKEAGPHFADAKETHIRLLESSVDRMKSRFGSSVIYWIWPKYSPEVQLRPAIRLLREAGQDNDSSQKAVHDAGTLVLNVGRSWASIRQPALLISRSGPAKSLRSYYTQFEAFKKSASAFQTSSLLAEEDRLKLAERACMDSRLLCDKAIAAWSATGPKLEIQLEDLQGELSDLSKELDAFASALRDTEQQRVRHYAQNVTDRARLLAALKNGGMHEARKTLLAQLDR